MTLEHFGAVRWVMTVGVATSVALVGCAGKQSQARMPAGGRGGSGPTAAITMPMPTTKPVAARRPVAETTVADTSVAASSEASSSGTSLTGKVVFVHLTQGAPALATGPRKDVVKGMVRAIDAEWVVVESDGRSLYIPRRSVLAIEGTRE